MSRWDLMYLRRPPWDSGVTPPELVEVVEHERLPPGRALDLGCGTGTNVVYLARHGFAAAGVDVAWLAVLRARWRILRAGLPRGAARAVRGDVRHLPHAVRTRGPYDLALDIGCFHNLDAAGRSAYAAGLRAVTRPGATFLLYTFRPPADPAAFGTWGVSAGDVAEAFRGGFRIVSLAEGSFRERTSAWYRFERVDA